MHDPRLTAGWQAFERDEFFAAHEHWESVWLEAAPPVRTWLQGLIQVAAARHKLAQGQRAACRRLLAKALPKLAGIPEDLGGVPAGLIAREAALLHASVG
jgi:hypothetical protein